MYIYLWVDEILYTEKNYIKIFEIFSIYSKENIILFIIIFDKYTIAFKCSFEILIIFSGFLCDIIKYFKMKTNIISIN